MLLSFAPHQENIEPGKFQICKLMEAEVETVLMICDYLITWTREASETRIVFSREMSCFCFRLTVYELGLLVLAAEPAWEATGLDSLDGNQR